MKPEVKTRQRQNSLKRLEKFVFRQTSWFAATHRLCEEAIVRLCSNAGIRKILSFPFPNREPEKWLFLVGCYNSGTTLIQHILSAHPKISALPREGVRFTQMLSDLELNGHHMFWDEQWKTVACPTDTDSKYAALQVKRDWRIFWKRGANIFLDKSVSNTARIGWLNSNFDNAHFIGIHRNGYCVAEGLHRRSRPPEWLKQETGLDHYPLAKAAEQWAMINETMLTDISTTRNLRISFEDLVEDPVSCARKIFVFLELDTPDMDWDGTNFTISGVSFEIHNPNPASLKRLGTSSADLTNIIDPVMARLRLHND